MAGMMKKTASAGASALPCVGYPAVGAGPPLGDKKIGEPFGSPMKYVNIC